MVELDTHSNPHFYPVADINVRPTKQLKLKIFHLTSISKIAWVVAVFITATTFAYSKNQYADNFEIEIFPTHKLLHVKNLWRGSGNQGYTYALVPKDSPLPDLPQNVKIIRTPVERVIILATVYLGPIQSLELHDLLIGISNLEFTNDPIVHERVELGKIQTVQTGSAIDIEEILLLQPDLILTSSTGNAIFDAHPQLERAGLPVVITSGYMEAHPLARSEWIKAIAALTDKEPEAEEIFNATASRYEALTKLTENIKNKPTIFCNSPYGGVWHISGGQSYTAKAFADAGADYLWADNPSSGGVPLDFEVIYFKAIQADIWINPGRYRSLETLLSQDERFLGFDAFRKGRVFNNTLRTNESGGNDIWERGIHKPDEVLADLIAIFHPDLLPNHEFIFYEQLK